MSAYLVGAIDVHDAAGYARYREATAPLIAALGDVELVSGDDHPLMFEGTSPANHLFILKFPSLDRVRAFLGSDAYRRCIPVRHASAHTCFIMAMRGLDEA